MSARRLGGASLALPSPPSGPGLPLCDSDPLRAITLGPSSVIGGVPFAPTWHGDSFAGGSLPFHQCESCSDPASPDEFVDVAVVGGGLSGLASAWLLRDRKPVLFDLRPRFGGNAMGESWEGIPHSMGSAYFIVPDRGSRLESMYQSLGFLRDARIDQGPFTFEWRGQISQDPCLQGCDPEQAAAVEAYRSLVQHFAFEAYPDIPLPEQDGWIRDLDRISLKAFLDAKVGPNLPLSYAAAIQAYCFSSFGVGWDELSAAAGWNFIAAEEFGRIVLPGGNVGLARAMWSQLRDLEQLGPCAGGNLLRAGCTVERIRLLASGGVEVRWREPGGKQRTMHAKHVILANAKHIGAFLIEELATLDEAKADAIQQIATVPYLVANVLLDRPLPTDIYDLFLLHDRRFPMSGSAFEQDRRIVDAVDGSFGLRPPSRRRDVLTLYWPLPWHTARFTIVGTDDWLTYAEIGASQVRRAVETLGLSVDDIAQVRLVRWGHAMPFAQPGQIADGIAETVRRPIAERIWFVNQDNWMLPAVETCLEEAFTYTDAIRARLG